MPQLVVIAMSLNEVARFRVAYEEDEREQQHRAWFQDNPLPMWVFDPETFAFLDVNEAAIQHYGYSRAEFLSMTILDIRPAEDVPRIIARVLAGFPGRTQKIPSRHRTRNGTLIDVEIYAQQVPWKSKRAEIVQIHDISELKRAETALRDLSGRLLQLQDVQQRKMARELHDAVGQTLTALLMKLALGRNLAEAHDAQTETTFGDCLALASRTLNEIRTFSYLLHPPMLDEEGIGAALDLYLEGFAERSGIKVRVAIPDDLGRLPEELEITLFRVVQEALTNVHRHSGSPTADVRLSRDSAALTLEVRDQGRGMPREILERVRRRGAIAGVGIAGMRERVAQLGGELALDSNVEGSVLRVTFPSVSRSHA